MLDYLLALDDDIKFEAEIKAIAKEMDTSLVALRNMVKRRDSARKKAAPPASAPDFVPGYLDAVANLVADFNAQHWFVNETAKHTSSRRPRTWRCTARATTGSRIKISKRCT
jgi:hypothetical protein